MPRKAKPEKTRQILGLSREQLKKRRVRSDLATRSRFKQAFTQIDKIYDKLDQAYTSSEGSIKIKGAIVGIWAKLAVDSLLRHKLFEKGFLQRITLLIDIFTTHVVSLQAISTIAQYGNKDHRVTVTRLVPVLLCAMKQGRNDVEVVALCISALFYSVDTCLNGPNKSHVVPFTASDVQSLLKMTIDALRMPDATQYCMDFALALLGSMAVDLHEEYMANPSVLAYLVACLRSADVSIRCAALAILVQLHISNAEVDTHSVYLHKIVAMATLTWPPNIRAAMQEYLDFQRVVSRCALDRNFYALGKTFVTIITRAEFFIQDIMLDFPEQEPSVSSRKDIDLPFRTWVDAVENSR
ncbi:hypothetical protein CERSUDRAFT_71973 [Gelatoporia subvermispora B]|uniref:Interferon-related developmental regulator N-terminal domain-containing protein n=1 Tax=Ceriporiopsis subvermispora (strain B) TaxID=914234 RepID=M2RP26_CERS8|nr:hypothetical protein CERSUDRAFT_71973 [Gelatoporia subvermispora B]